MKQLFNFFPPNFLDGASTVQLTLGEPLNLGKNIGVVLKGVIGVGTVGQHNEDQLTLRLASLQDTLNVEQIIGLNKGFNYICESLNATVAIVSVVRLEQEWKSNSHEIKESITQSMLAQLMRQERDITDTLTALGRSDVRNRIIWAIQRFNRLSEVAGMPAKSVRIASHIGVRQETVSRAITSMCNDGTLIKNKKLNTVNIRVI